MIAAVATGKVRGSKEFVMVPLNAVVTLIHIGRLFCYLTHRLNTNEKISDGWCPVLIIDKMQYTSVSEKSNLCGNGRDR